MFLVSCTGAEVETSRDTGLEGMSPFPKSAGMSSLPLAGEAGAIAGGEALPLVAGKMLAQVYNLAAAK